MDEARPRPTRDYSLLSEALSLRLNRLEPQYGGYEAFVGKLGISKGTYYALAHDKGNPRFDTVERLAANLGMTFFELMGFTTDEARAAFAHIGLCYDDELKTARASGGSLVTAVLAHRLGQIIEQQGGYRVVMRKIGISTGAYWALRHNKGNPTFQTIERIARSLKFPVYEFFGFTEEQVEQVYARDGLDYRRMAREVARRNRPYKPARVAAAAV